MKAHTVAETVTLTDTQSITESGTGTHVGTGTVTNTGTSVLSATDYYTITATLTGTVKVAVSYFSWSGTSTNTTTNTRTTTAAGPLQSTNVFTNVVTRTVTNSRNGTETKTISAATTGFVTFTGTTTVTVTNTVTRTAGARQGSGVRTVTANGTAVQNGTALWTWHPTATATQTNIATDTRVLTSTAVVTLTKTLTTTATDTSTGGQCLDLWRNTTCGEWCLRETQADRKVCEVYLDCYLAHHCGPSTCGGQDQICGVNVVRPASGMAPKIIADQVYQCMACPGSTPVTSCAGLPDTTPCDDSNACTHNDRCFGGACTLNQPTICTALDGCHEPGTCAPATGVCSNPAKVCTAMDACHIAGTCDLRVGACNNPVAPGCTVGAGKTWTAAADDEKLFGHVVARADGTALAMGRKALYRVDSAGAVSPFGPALGDEYQVDTVHGAYAGGSSGSDFVVYDVNGSEVLRVAQPANARVYLAPGRPVVVMALLVSQGEEQYTGSLRFVGESRDVVVPVEGFRRTFMTKDYFIVTTRTATIIYDYAGTEVQRYATAAGRMAAASATRTFAFVAHGTMDVIHVELPSAALGTAVTLDAPVWHLALSPDGRFSVATTQQKAYLFQDGALVRTQAIPADYISSADISEEGVAVLGTQNGDGSTKLVGMTVAGTGTFAITRPSKDRRGLHPLVRFAPGGRAFLTSERDGASRFNLTFTP